MASETIIQFQFTLTVKLIVYLKLIENVVYVTSLKMSFILFLSVTCL